MINASKSVDLKLALKGRVKFTMNRGSLQALVHSLNTERDSLGKLIKCVKSTREWQAKEPTNTSVAMALNFSKARESAELLYQVACKCWKCTRHPLHNVMMRLDHRIPTDPKRNAKSFPITFGLCFSIEEAVLHEIEVATSTIQPLPAKTVVKFQPRSVHLI